MDLLIESELLKNSTHIINHASLQNILANFGYQNINDKINHLKQKRVIIALKKGIYIHNSLTNHIIYSKELISNHLSPQPSYISLDYCLSYYNLIPERVYEITAITTGRDKKFETELGVFSYKKLKKELFDLGIKIETKNEVNFLIATKEKSLCDKLYLNTLPYLTSQKNLIDFLENDLRISIDDLLNFDTEIIKEYYDISKSKKINLFLNLIKTL